MEKSERIDAAFFRLDVEEDDEEDDEDEDDDESVKSLLLDSVLGCLAGDDLFEVDVLTLFLSEDVDELDIRDDEDVVVGSLALTSEDTDGDLLRLDEDVCCCCCCLSFCLLSELSVW